MAESCAVERMYLEFGENWTCWQIAVGEDSERVLRHWDVDTDQIRLGEAIVSDLPTKHGVTYMRPSREHDTIREPSRLKWTAVT